MMAAAPSGPRHFLDLDKLDTAALRQILDRSLEFKGAKGAGDKLKATIDSVQPLLAPVRAGQRVATLKLRLDNQPYGEFPVVALEDVPVAGILGRGWDAIRLFFQ